MPEYKWVKWKGKMHLKVGSHLFTLKEAQRADTRNIKYKRSKKKRKHK